MSDDIRLEVVERVHGAGPSVRAEMARRRVTQDQVAALLGMSQPQISKRLLGEIPFDLGELRRIAEFLDVPVMTFLPAGSAAGAA